MLLSTRPLFLDEIEDKGIGGIGVALGKRKLITDIAGTIASMVDKSQESRVKYDPSGTALKMRSSASSARVI